MKRRSAPKPTKQKPGPGQMSRYQRKQAAQRGQWRAAERAGGRPMTPTDEITHLLARLQERFLALHWAFVLCALGLPVSALAGWFGPSNYNECILDNVRGVVNNTAALVVEHACREKFPKFDWSNVRFDDEALKPESLKNLNATDGSVDSSGIFSVTIYNGNADLAITSMTLLINPGRDREIKNSQQYKVVTLIPPLTAKEISLRVVVQPSQDFLWGIAEARGISQR